MTSQEFLLFNIGAAVVFVVWYLSARKKTTRQPVKLNLYAKDSAVVPLPAEKISDNANGDQQKSSGQQVPIDLQQAFQIRQKTSHQNQAQPKSLNQFFNYNGHTWDAYEVLGVPGGSSIEKVTEAYQKALRNTNQESHAFLETAYKAILHKI